MRHRVTITVLAAAILELPMHAQGPWSGCWQRDSIEAVASAACKWQIDNFARCGHNELAWTGGALYIGMYEWADQVGDKAAVKFLTALGKRNNWGLLPRVYHADDICVGQTYLKLYARTGDDKMAQAVRSRAYYVSTHPSDAPLSRRQKRGTERWSWCDALFMAPPVYAHLYALTGESVYADFMLKEFRECTDSLFDRDEGLYYRDCLRIGLREANGAKQFWGRGNGWVFAAISRILEALPEDYWQRGYFEEIFRQMATSIVKCQDSAGHWHASLLDPGSYPEPENSASAFFVYGLAWGIRHALLDEDRFLEPLQRGWSALVEGVHPEGMPGYIQPVGADPRHTGYDSTDVYGIGGFLLAASELLKLLQ